jgi:PAS domain S-box-containing protein
MKNKQHNLPYNLAEKLNDASIDRVIAIDTSWKIIAWNKTTEIITGITKQQALNRQLQDVFPQLQQDYKIINAFESALKGNTCFLPSQPEAFNRNYYENHFMPLYDDHDRVIGVMNIMHDVAHRIKVEQQLNKLNAELNDRYHQLEKANSKLAIFTAISGHDLKAPIKKVYTSLEFIINTDGANLSDRSKAALRRIQASLNRMNLLLDDILSLTTTDNFNEEHTIINLTEIAGNALQALQKKIKDKQAIIEMSALPSITGFKQMLNNLFYNLIDNALKFQPRGNIPKLSITATTISLLPKLFPQSEEGKEYIGIHFSDNGIGFNQYDAEKIFTMFEQLHPEAAYQGSGIGLAICKRIMEAHKGYITAESIPGQGATIHCYFPIEISNDLPGPNTLQAIE